METQIITPAPDPVKKVSGRTKAALWLMIGPTALLIGVFILYAIVNWVVVGIDTSSSDPSVRCPSSVSGGITSCTPESQFNETPLIVTLMNVALFIVGSVFVLTWLPGLIIGIVLLATKPKPLA